MKGGGIFTRPVDAADELETWRHLAPALDAALCRLIAAQGERAEPELLALQHRVADLREKRVTLRLNALDNP